MSRTVSIPTLLEGWVSDAPALRIEGLCPYADRVGPRQAYVHNGSGCIGEAERRGARIAFCGERTDTSGVSIPVVRIPGLEARIPELAARFHRYPAEQLKIACVAGRERSTPVVHYIAQSWQRAGGGAGIVSATGHGPFRNPVQGAGELQDVYSLQRILSDCLDDDCETVTMEVAPRYLEQGWLDDLAFEVAVFTGRGEPAFRPMFTDCRPRFAVVDHDGAEGKTLTRLMGEGVQVLTVGTNGATELQGSILGMDSQGMTIRVAGPWGGGEIRTGLLGRDNLSSLLAAAGALALMGMPWDRVMHQVEIMSAVPGRMTCVGGEANQPSAVIDHARTPQELENVLLALRSHLHGRLTCVLAADECPRLDLVRVARAFSDRVFPVSTAGRSDAIRQAIRESGRGDIVLIAGAGQGSWRRNGEAEVRFLLEEAA